MSPHPASERRTGGAARPEAEFSPTAALTSTEAPEMTTDSSTAVLSASGGRRWELWFARRLGPPRKKTVTRYGFKHTTRVRRPELPPNANDRLHWRVKAPWIAEWRKAGCAAAVAHRMPDLGRVCISAVIYRSHIGRADADGDLARLKPIVDGLVDAGVVPDDRRQFVEYGPMIEHRATGEPGILLIIEEVEQAR